MRIEILRGAGYVVIRNYGAWPLGVYFSFSAGYAGVFVRAGSFLLR